MRSLVHSTYSTNTKNTEKPTVPPETLVVDPYWVAGPHEIAPDTKPVALEHEEEKTVRPTE